MIRKFGHIADAVDNGKEAIDILNRLSYDLVLMDVQMPEMDGYTATAIIRESENSKRKTVPIVAMTANAMKGDRLKCLDAGMDDYIAKPVDPESVLTMIDKWASREKNTATTI